MKAAVEHLRRLVDSVNVRYDDDLAALRVMASRHHEPLIKDLMWALDRKRKQVLATVLEEAIGKVEWPPETDSATA